MSVEVGEEEDKKTITVSVSKERIEDRVGVTFRWQDSEDAIIIHGISSSSLFAGTNLRVGMTVESINEFKAEFMSLKQAMNLLRQAEDVITIVASGEGDADPITPNPSTEEDEEEFHKDSSIIVVPQDSIEVAGDHSCRGFPEVEDIVPVAASADSSTEAEISVAAELNATPVNTTDSFTHRHDEEEIFTATATKPTPESLTGLGLKDHPEAGVLISSISPTSIFLDSALRPGLKIIAINDTECQFLTKQAVAAILRSCEGTITVHAVQVDLAVASAAVAGTGIITATVVKARQDSKVGLGISDRFEGKKAFPIITSIAPDGLCGNTRLEVDMRVLCINGVSCRGRDDAVAMLRMAHSHLTIVAGQKDMVAATVTKATRDTKVGLNMTRRDGVLVVSSLPKNGLLARTDLKEGMQILQINSVDVRHMTGQEVVNIVARSMGTVTVLAKETNEQAQASGRGAETTTSTASSFAVSQNTSTRTTTRPAAVAMSAAATSTTATTATTAPRAGTRAGIASVAESLLEMAGNFVDV